jgi:hypothetical protein
MLMDAARRATYAARVADILRIERQWNRGCRIMHANYRMATAANAEEHYLWSQVLAANSSETTEGGEHAS